MLISFLPSILPSACVSLWVPSSACNDPCARLKLVWRLIINDCHRRATDSWAVLSEHLWYSSTYGGWALMLSEQLWWSSTYDGWALMMVELLWWSSTYDGWAVLNEHLWWLSTYDGWALMHGSHKPGGKDWSGRVCLSLTTAFVLLLDKSSFPLKSSCSSLNPLNILRVEGPRCIALDLLQSKHLKGQSGLPVSPATLISFLQNRSYITTISKKWHGTVNWTKNCPL